MKSAIIHSVNAGVVIPRFSNFAPDDADCKTFLRSFFAAVFFTPLKCIFSACLGG
jgi:hypothetical protein